MRYLRGGICGKQIDYISLNLIFLNRTIHIMDLLSWKNKIMPEGADINTK